MAMKFLFRTAALAAALLAAAACIYPYEVDFHQGSELPLVVEGDIHIGGITTVKLSYVKPFGTEESAGGSVLATGYIEGEDGTRVEGYQLNTLTFDTSQLRQNQRYRLHLETLNAQTHSVANVFESDWLSPAPAPTIDGLSYSYHPEYEELWIGLSMHTHGSHHFRWSFSETWEYHSDVSTWFEYKPETRTVGYYDRTNLYYCWKSDNSSQINIFSTANQTEDRFEELAFYTIPLNDRRLQVLYRIKVQLEGMSENAYNYWYNMQQNSEGQGSIFSPTPSEMASNVHCISNPDVQVMGYLNAAVQAEATMYYDNELNDYYKPGRRMNLFEQQVSVSQLDSMAFWYRQGYLPYQAVYETMSADPTHYMWGLKQCIDCRELGGTKTKPADWPNDHQ